MERTHLKPLRALLGFFFEHLYTTLAWSYDAVAWLSSVGQWRTWQSAAVARYAGRVLELGHGPGHVLLDLERAGNRVTGVDPSPQMARLASRRLRRQASSAGLVRARAQHLPFASGSHAAIIATFPTGYIFDSRTLAEVSRVLEPAGELVVIGVVEITGSGVLDRLAGWLYRITGQSGDPDPDWLIPLAQAGLEAELETVNQPRARVLRLHAVRRTSPASRPLPPGIVRDGG